MSRLPTIDGDFHSWGTVLNDFLAQGHNSDGSLKNVPPVFLVPKPSGGDDTTAIHAITAAARAVGGTTAFQAGTYKANLSLKSGDRLVGAYADLSNQTLGTVIQAFNSSLDTIKVAQGAGVYQTNIALENLAIKGGSNGFATYNGLSYLRVRNVAISGATNAQFYAESWIEEVDFEFVRMTNGTDGFRIANIVDGGNYIDKAVFKHCYAAGNSRNGWRFEATVFDAVTWDTPNITFNGQHGFYLNGGARCLTIIDASTESNGNTGKKNRTTLTGTVSSGATSATLASATGWATGDGICIRGAGSLGADFYVLSTAQGGPGVTVSGTTVSWTGGTSTTVTSPFVTNAEFDDFLFTQSIGTPGRIMFINPDIGGEGSAGRLRYAINAAPINPGDLIVLGGQGSNDTPIYDPNRSATVLGGTWGVRRPATFSGWDFRGGVLLPADNTSNTGDAAPAFYGGSRGKDTIFGLPDSVGNGTGTRGKYSWRIGDLNRTEALSLDGTTQQLLANGNILANDGITTKYLSGAGKTSVVDGDFTTAPLNGTIAVHYDTTAAKTYISVRANFTWHVMAGPI